MTTKQELILLFIYSEYANDQKRIIHVLERYNYTDQPNLGQNLEPLLIDNYIIVSGLAYNGTPFSYSTTEKGNHYIKEQLNDKRILEYVSKMENPDLLFKITEVLIERKSSI